jgi:hypothetical protein
LLKHICILFLFCCYFACTEAQEAVAVRHYVFDHFSEGTVWQKNGSTDQAMLNYNVLSREIVFESSPGQFMALASPEKVDTVFIEGRKFIPVNNEFYELLTSGPYFLMLQYGCSIKEPGARIGYGMTTVTSASVAIKSLIRNGGAYSLVLPDGFEVAPAYTYWIRIDGRYTRVTNVKQVIALVPVKKQQLAEFVKKNNTSFSKKQDIIALLQQL